MPPAPASAPTHSLRRAGAESLFVYNHTSGAAYTELSSGSGQREGILDPGFSAGWSVYPADYTGDGHTDLLLYNQASGGAADPGFSAGWDVYVGAFG